MLKQIGLALPLLWMLAAAAPAPSSEPIQEERLIDELRRPLCAALDRWRPKKPSEPVLRPGGSGDAVEVDLIGLSGHASIFSVEGVCPNCADRMLTYRDASGAKFCDVGGIAG